MSRHGLLSGLVAVSAAILLFALATPSSAAQRTVTIYQIQDTTSVGHVALGSPDTVTTQGIITGADTRPTGFSFYIQDPIGGAFSGAAGVLYAMLFGIVPLEAIGFVTSGNVVFATLIGGSGSLYGPIIGSFVFIWLSESVSTLWARWPLLLGLAFVIVVMFFRGGVVEAWSRFWLWRSSKLKA